MVADPASLLVDPAVQRLFAVLPGARLVGGCVRDGLAGRPSADIDMASPLPPQDVAEALSSAGLRVIPTGLAHGTVTAMIGDRPFEITTLRRDVVTDGRHAEVVWTDDWREDAARRDFTINAMSLSPDRRLHDYFGGEADLRAGRVRFVGNAHTRVAEDYLRILRFFRFQARYGTGTPDSEALAAIRAGLGGLAHLSVERVWSELKRILEAPDPTEAVWLMAETGVLAAVMPEGAHARDLSGFPPDPVLRTAALLTGDRAAFSGRLKLSHAEDTYLAALTRQPFPVDGPYDDSCLLRWLADDELRIIIGRSFLAGQPEGVRDRLRTLPRPVFPLAGRDALAIGLVPGPAIGALLGDVRNWWLAGGCKADADSCRAELARRAAASRAGFSPPGRARI